MSVLFTGHKRYVELSKYQRLRNLYNPFRSNQSFDIICMIQHSPRESFKTRPHQPLRHLPPPTLFGLPSSAHQTLPKPSSSHTIRSLTNSLANFLPIHPDPVQPLPVQFSAQPPQPPIGITQILQNNSKHLSRVHLQCHLRAPHRNRPAVEPTQRRFHQRPV